MTPQGSAPDGPVWLGICATTGKRSYSTRKAARRSERQQRAAKGHMSTYQCECGWWHLGHLPAEVVAGHVTRDEIRPRGSA
jgi:hypothetical protein